MDSQPDQESNGLYVPHSHFDDYHSDLAAYFEVVENEMIDIAGDEDYVKDLLRESQSETDFKLEHDLKFNSHLETDGNRLVSGIQDFVKSTMKAKFKPLKSHLFTQQEVEEVLQWSSRDLTVCKSF